MSVQSEITRIESAKTAIATAIEGKGVTVPEGTKLDGLAALVESIEAGGGGGIPGYNIISGTYTPETDITSYFAVYQTESLASSSSQISKILDACTAFSFPVIAGLDDAISTFPCAVLNAFSCGRSMSYNAKSSSSGATAVITSCLKSSKISTSNYGLVVYLVCDSSYPLRAGRTYQWVLLIPEYIQI